MIYRYKASTATGKQRRPRVDVRDECWTLKVDFVAETVEEARLLASWRTLLPKAAREAGFDFHLSESQGQ